MPKTFAVIILKVEQFHFMTQVMHQKDADEMANSVDPDSDCSSRVCTVCPDLSVRKLRNITVCPKDEDRMANTEDPDQSVVQTYFSKTVGKHC